MCLLLQTSADFLTVIGRNLMADNYYVIKVKTFSAI